MTRFSASPSPCSSCCNSLVISTTLLVRSICLLSETREMPPGFSEVCKLTAVFSRPGSSRLCRPKLLERFHEPLPTANPLSSQVLRRHLAGTDECQDCLLWQRNGSRRAPEV